MFRGERFMNQKSQLYVYDISFKFQAFVCVSLSLYDFFNFF